MTASSKHIRFQNLPTSQSTDRTATVLVQDPSLQSSRIVRHSLTRHHSEPLPNDQAPRNNVDNNPAGLSASALAQASYGLQQPDATAAEAQVDELQRLMVADDGNTRAAATRDLAAVSNRCCAQHQAHLM